MNENMKKELNKRLGIDQKFLTEGKWIPFGKGIDLLCRPATLHNTDMQREVFRNKTIDPIALLRNPEKADDPEVQAAYADVLFKTVILAIRINDNVEKLESAEDVLYLMQSFPDVFRVFSFKIVDRETFSVITEDEAKN